jgi:hypothetical protein
MFRLLRLVFPIALVLVVGLALSWGLAGCSNSSAPRNDNMATESKMKDDKMMKDKMGDGKMNDDKMKDKMSDSKMQDKMGTDKK